MKRVEKKSSRASRHARIRAKIAGTQERPRLVVFRSNQHLYAQLVDDEKGHTMAAVSDFGVKGGKTLKDKAVLLGGMIAQKAKEKKIASVVFDRGGYKYHGLVKALADGAREEGLQL
ncbi:MAG: 50S ribosomal protein L18 [Candidatus Wildermuthbacteria bacterium]|nr:50S ribosomal protein L18 [Candidatus Wildermuthbacteria bacterium]